MTPDERRAEEERQRKARRAEMRRRIAARPNAVRFAELERMLLAYGFSSRQGPGSHVVFARGGQRLAVPFRRGTLLPVYVRLALALIGEHEDE